MHLLDRASAPRDHGELGIEALQIERTDNAVMPLLHEEHPRSGLELLLQQLELALRETKALDVVTRVCIWIRKEDFRRRLLDDRPCDATPKHTTRRLRGRA